jgi:hypothetical protein
MRKCFHSKQMTAVFAHGCRDGQTRGFAALDLFTHEGVRACSAAALVRGTKGGSRWRRVLDSDFWILDSLLAASGCTEFLSDLCSLVLT